MSEFSSTFKKMRRSKKITVETAAEKLGVTVRTLRGYEQGEFEPSLDTVIKAAEFFNCSVDELLGRENPNTINIQVDNKRFVDIYNELPKDFQEILVEAMRQLSQSQIRQGGTLELSTAISEIEAEKNDESGVC